MNSDYIHEHGRRVFAEHIGLEGTFPDAIFAFNDAMALGVLDVLNDHHKQVPEDIQVIGFDNTDLAQYIGLSTVHVPLRQIGEEAGRLVTERIQNKDAKSISVTLNTQLIARKPRSTRGIN